MSTPFISPLLEFWDVDNVLIYRCIMFQIWIVFYIDIWLKISYQTEEVSNCGLPCNIVHYTLLIITYISFYHLLFNRGKREVQYIVYKFKYILLKIIMSADLRKTSTIRSVHMSKDISFQLGGSRKHKALWNAWH